MKKYLVVWFYTNREGKILLANSFISSHPLDWFQKAMEEREAWNYPPEGIVWWTKITSKQYRSCKWNWF